MTKQQKDFRNHFDSTSLLEIAISQVLDHTTCHRIVSSYFKIALLDFVMLDADSEYRTEHRCSSKTSKFVFFILMQNYIPKWISIIW